MICNQMCVRCAKNSDASPTGLRAASVVRFMLASIYSLYIYTYIYKWYADRSHWWQTRPTSRLHWALGCAELRLSLLLVYSTWRWARITPRAAKTTWFCRWAKSGSGSLKTGRRLYTPNFNELCVDTLRDDDDVDDDTGTETVAGGVVYINITFVHLKANEKIRLLWR